MALIVQEPGDGEIGKWCGGCQRVLALGSFCLNRRRPDGRSDRCRQCAQAYQLDRTSKAETFVRQYRVTARRAAIEAYGGVCACCGENQDLFLMIQVGQRRRATPVDLSRLQKQRYPAGAARVLCFNCYGAERSWGRCPHAGREGVGVSDPSLDSDDRQKWSNPAPDKEKAAVERSSVGEGGIEPL